jgi:hypothetical protein
MPGCFPLLFRVGDRGGRFRRVIIRSKTIQMYNALYMWLARNIRAEKGARAGYFAYRAWFLAALVIFAAAYALCGQGPMSSGSSDTFEILFGDSGPFKTDASSFAWVRPELLGGKGAGYWHRAVFLARPAEGALGDVFLADFKIASDRRIRDFRRVRNLSRTADADEDVLVVDGAGKAAFAGSAQGLYRTAVLMDLSGERGELTSGWSRWQRLADQITNFQKYGRKKGVDCRRYIFADPPEKVVLEYEGRVLKVKTPDASFEIDETGKTDSPAVVAQEMVKAPQAMLSFAVDTARAVSWIGPEKIAWLEKNWFNFTDWLARARYALGGDDSPPVLLGSAGPKKTREPGDLPDWPPPEMAPLVGPEAEGEGRWFQMDDGLFSDSRQGPFLFYYSFLRADPERPFARVYMTAWDPARVELRMMAGTVEPAPSTGLAGIGEVPRDAADDQVSRLVGAFNGAFQALHGEWGMVLDRMPLLPPKPYAATVAVLEDNRIAMGTWPYPVGEIPQEIRDLRQNLLPLVQDGLVNPFKYKHWGAAPWKTPDRVYTIRTALCLTKVGKAIYFYGDHLTAETLGGVMIAAGCDYAVHLDMNPGHSGFEFYRVDPEGAEPKRGRELIDGAEAEGAVPRRPDLFFRAKKLAEEMRHQRFPRYINRDPRDFFYLIRRKSIFDDPPASTGGWKPIAPKPAVPAAAASADLGKGLRLYKVDLEQVEITLETEEPSDALTAVQFSMSKEGITTGARLKGEIIETLQPGEPALKLDEGRPALLAADENQDGETLVQGVPEAIARRVESEAGMAVDSNGYLFAATGPAAQTNGLFEALKSVGGREVLGLLPAGNDGGKNYWIAVRHRPRPAWKRIFPEVKPVPRDVWRRAYWKPKEDLTPGPTQLNGEGS